MGIQNTLFNENSSNNHWKGLEFDSVIAYDVSQANLKGTDEIGMLYTMATRAMHDLTMISNGQVSTAINEKASRQLTIEHELIR